MAINTLSASSRVLHERNLLALSYMNPSPRYGADGSIDYANFFSRSCVAQGSYHRLRRGGVDVAVLGFGLNDPDRYPGREGVARIVQDLSAFHHAVREHSSLAGIARSAADVRKLRRAGKMAFVLALTGVYLDGALEMLDGYAELGVRMAHPPFDTRAGRSILAWKGTRGLTAFDRRVLQRMEQLGMAIDLSHASDRMVGETLKMTSGPVLVSHGMCRALSPTKRNLTDNQIRAIAGTGGVIGVHFAGQLIDPEYGRRLDASGFREELARWVEGLKRKYPDPADFARKRYNVQRWERSRAYALYQSVPPPDIG